MYNDKLEVNFNAPIGRYIVVKAGSYEITAETQKLNVKIGDYGWSAYMKHHP